MNKYKLIKVNHLPYQLEKNGIIVADVFLSVFGGLNRNFSITTIDGDVYRLKYARFMFVGEITLFKNGIKYARFTKRTCTSLEFKLGINFSGEIYIDDKIVCKVEIERFKKNIDLEISWEINIDNLDFILLTLIVENIVFV